MLRRFLLILAGLGAALVLFCYWTAVQDPVVRHARIPNQCRNWTTPVAEVDPS